MEVYDYVITKPELNDDTLAHYGIAKKVHKYIDKYLKNGKWIYRYKSKAEELSAKARRKKAGIINPAEISRTADYGTRHARVMRVGPNEIDNGRGFKRSPGLRNTYDRNWTWTFNKTKTTKVNLPKNKNVTSRGYSGSQGSGESKRQRNLGTRYNSQDTESKFYRARRLSSAHDRIRKKDKKLDSQLKNAYTKTKKNTKVTLHKDGAIYNNISAYDADRMLTSRGYPSASSWEKDVQRNNKATSGVLRGRANREYIKNHSALKRASSSKKNGNMMNDVYTRETVGKRKRRIKQINDEERTLLSKGWKISNGILYPPNYKSNKKKKK